MAEPNGGVSWTSILDKGLEGWMAYLNRPRDPVIGNLSPYGPSTNDNQVALLQMQMQAQQSNQSMLLMAAAAAVGLYLLLR